MEEEFHREHSTSTEQEEEFITKSVRYLPNKWGKVLSRFTSDNPIKDVQDRVFGFVMTAKTLSVDQRELAAKIDALSSALPKINRRIISVAFNEGEQTLKVFKKSLAWNTLLKGDKIKKFYEFLQNLGLGTRLLPGVKVIQPNCQGSFPFLKVTFISGWER